MDQSARPAALRILMLHGYAQSGPEFEIKTRRLCDFLSKRLPEPLRADYPGGYEFKYANAPHEMPIFENGIHERSVYGWAPTLAIMEEYKGLPLSLDYIRDFIIKEGPFDGVMGFSQGGAFAMMVASWCEAAVDPERRRALASQGVPITKTPPQGPFKFAVSFSGFRGPAKFYDGHYNPLIKTPTLLVRAQWDHMVSDQSAQELADTCDQPETICHPGSHFVPGGEKYLETVARFMARTMLDGDDHYEHGSVMQYSGNTSDDNASTYTESVGSSDSAPRRTRVRCISKKRYRTLVRREVSRDVSPF